MPSTRNSKKRNHTKLASPKKKQKVSACFVVLDKSSIQSWERKVKIFCVIRSGESRGNRDKSYLSNARPRLTLAGLPSLVGYPIDQLANLYFHYTSVPRYTHMTD